jgi:hypothetical protein
MPKKFQKGEKVIIDSTPAKLKLIQAQELQPGQEVFIIKKDFLDDGKNFYQVGTTPDDKMTYVLPDIYLQKIENSK